MSKKYEKCLFECEDYIKMKLNENKMQIFLSSLPIHIK